MSNPSFHLHPAWALLLLLSPACTSESANTDHCANNDGDEYCADLFPDRPHCNSGDRSEACNIDHLGESVRQFGCVSAEELRCPAPCGAQPTCEIPPTTESTTTSASTGPSPAESSTTEDESSTSDNTSTGPDCRGDEDCDQPAAPFCVGGSCVPCGDSVAADPDSACAQLDPTKPLCVNDACVECTARDAGACVGTTPVCDTETNTCQSCSFHEQCQALGLPACNIALGSCFAADAVTEIDASINGSVQPVIDAVADGAAHAIVITGGTGNHALTIDGGKTIAIVSDGSSIHELRGDGNTPVISVAGLGTTAYLHRLALEDGDGWGISVTASATLGADAVRVVQNTGGGVQLSTGSTAQLRNCMIGGTNNSPAIQSAAATLNLLYSTVAGNFGTSPALSCTGGTITVRNSILVSRADDAVDCVATIEDSFEAQGAGFDETWFDLDAGELGLNNAGDFEGVAVWRTGDPPFDFDGDARPLQDRTSDYAGADVP